MNGNKLKLALDFDDTLKPFLRPWFDWHNETYETSHEVHEVTEYDLGSLMGLSNQELQRRVDEFQDYEMSTANINIFPEAIEVLKSLQQFFQYVIITARKRRFKPYTLDQLRLGMPDIEFEIYHREDYEGLKMSKAIFAKTLGCIALVEDHPGHAHEAHELGLGAILLTAQPNLSYIGPVERADSWSRVDELLRQIYNSATGSS
ncbi:MAG TPA: hypothetical protein VGA08_01005 [Candidatus Saccharimonadales bacterium]